MGFQFGKLCFNRVGEGMSVTFFGVLVILGILFVFFKLRNSSLTNTFKTFYFISIIFLIVFDIGYIAKIGTFTIEINYIFSIINFILSIVALFFVKVSRPALRGFALLMSSLLIGLLIPLVFKLSYRSVAFNDAWDLYFDSDLILGNVTISSHSLFLIIRIMIFAISFITFTAIVTKKDLLKMSRILYKISWGLISISVVEFFVSNFISPFLFRQICFNIFGQSDATYTLPRLLGGKIYLPMLFMREPSSFARCLMFLCINNILYTKLKDKSKEKIILSIFCLFFLLVMSMSLTSYIYLIAILFLAWSSLKNKRLKKYILIAIPVVMVILLISMGNRIDMILESYKFVNEDPRKLSRSSEIIRIYSIFNNFNYFVKYPLFGCGIGTIYSYSSLISMLSNIGILGMAAFIYFISKCLNQKFNAKNISFLLIVFVLISSILTGHLSHLMYLETAGYLYIFVKYIDICNKGGELINE